MAHSMFSTYDPLFLKKDALLDKKVTTSDKDVSVIVIANQKGGCGKTTTSINLSADLANRGFKTLLIDLDPQSHSTLGIGIETDDLSLSVYDVMAKNVDFKDIILNTYIPNLDIAPATPLLSGTQLEIADLIGREGILRTALYKSINLGLIAYDFIIIDCSPALNLITINGLVTAHLLLIPMQTHYFSLEGMKELFPIVQIVKDRLNPPLEILGILPTLFDDRTPMSEELLKQLYEYFQDHVFKSAIHLDPKLAEASAHRQSIFDYAPESTGAKDYASLTDEVIQLTHKHIVGQKND